MHHHTPTLIGNLVLLHGVLCHIVKINEEGMVTLQPDEPSDHTLFFIDREQLTNPHSIDCDG